MSIVTSYFLWFSAGGAVGGAAATGSGVCEVIGNSGTGAREDGILRPKTHNELYLCKCGLRYAYFSNPKDAFYLIHLTTILPSTFYY